MAASHFHPPPPQPHHVKCVLVGDTYSGKTATVQTLKYDHFPHDYIPTTCDAHSHEFILPEVGGSGKVQMDYWDTVEGNEEYERLRPLSYPNADIFLLCFSITSPASLDHIRTKYLPEIQQHCPDVPYLLVGLKSDLRKDMEEKLKKQDESREIEFVTLEAARALAKEIGASSEYIECSSMTMDNLKHMFEEAARAAIRNRQKPAVEEEKERKKSCIVL